MNGPLLLCMEDLLSWVDSCKLLSHIVSNYIQLAEAYCSLNLVITSKTHDAVLIVFQNLLTDADADVACRRC